MTHSWKYFFDVPVYRLSESQYESDWNCSRENATLVSNKEIYSKNPEMEMSAHMALRKSFGGSWRYNEIIGYIRLYLLGLQIRGEYHANDVRRNYKTRKKILRYKTHKLADELDFSLKQNNHEIFSIILKYLHNCRRELNKKSKVKRYIDSSLLEAIGQHVDWKNLFFDNAKILDETLSMQIKIND